MTTTVHANAPNEITRYKQRLEQLYDLVERAVKRINQEAKIVRNTQIEINEQLTGPYSVPSLEVSIPGNPGIRLIPKGIYNIGARGRVDARSRLSTQILVWVEDGGPSMTTNVREGETEFESASRPVFTGVPEGWAWTDNQHTELVHLTEQLFIDRVLPELVL